MIRPGKSSCPTESSCGKGNSSYNYKEMNCISICPTGFDCKNNSITSPVTPYLLFDNDYSKLTTFTNNSAVVATKERGYYFGINSQSTLASKYVPAPDFTLNL